MVRREVVERAGTFDDRMYGCCEDSDFGWRANICGFHAIYNPDAIASHDVHGTFNPNRDKDLFIYLLRRNRVRSLLVNYEPASLLRFALPYIGMSLLESFSGPGRWSKLRAIGWNLLNLRDTLGRRRYVQELRRVKDNELWPLFANGIRGPGGDALHRLEKSAFEEKIALKNTEELRDRV
jgi:GT2 family glycosyltransferase